LSKLLCWQSPGGLGEFGMNMLVLRTGDDMILIDAGMMFPRRNCSRGHRHPDITYLKQNAAPPAILLTHGHEDHIGALPTFARAERADLRHAFHACAGSQAPGRARLLDKTTCAK